MLGRRPIGGAPICGSSSPARSPLSPCGSVTVLTPFAFARATTMPVILKRHDTTPDLEVTLEAPPGTPVDLTGCAVRFLMRPVGSSTLKIDAVASIEDPTAGTVSYEWQAADTDTAGEFSAEFEVTFPDGLVRTFPGPGYLRVSIVEDLG